MWRLPAVRPFLRDLLCTSRVPPIQAAWDLLACEGQQGSSEERAAAAGRTYELLFLQLSPLLGPAGVHAIFARSLSLAGADHSCLKNVSTGLDHEHTQAARLRDSLLSQAPTEVTEAAAGLFATFLALLGTIIGDEPTTGAIQRPRAPSPAPSERKS